MRRLQRAVIGLAVVLGITSTASATGITKYQFCFDNVTNNSSHADDIACQLELLVYKYKGYNSKVVFEVKNNGPIASTIADVYWDDDNSLLKYFLSYPSDWTPPATPGDLPGGNGATPPFHANKSIDADNPSTDGIHPGETAYFVLKLNDGKSIWDVKNDLESGDLRVGVHVQGEPYGKSDSFVTYDCDCEPQTDIPEPGTTALLGLGLLGLGIADRRRRRRA